MKGFSTYILLWISLFFAVATYGIYQKKQKALHKSAPINWPIRPPQRVFPPQTTPPSRPEREPIVVQPEFVNWPPLRQVGNLGEVLSDIESHLPAGHIYKDSDKITWGHESTHGINSDLRNKFQRGNRVNGFYVLKNRGVIISEPKTTISTVARLVPSSLRGGVYDLYLVSQASSWNDTPLYILDEYVAYTNGSAVRKDLGIQDRAESVRYMFEFNVYSITLAKAIKQNDGNYNDKQFKAFLMWNIQRTMEIFDGEMAAKEYWNRFQTAPDAAELRSFADNYFGKTWCDKMLWQRL